MSVTGVFRRPGGGAGFRHLRAKSRRYAAVALRNAPAGAVRGGFFFRVEKEPMAQATLSWPFGPIHLEKRQGVGAIGRNGCAAPASMPPIPYGSQKIFRNWVGEVQGPPADPLGPGGPVCRPYKKTARATARVAPTVLREHI